MIGAYWGEDIEEMVYEGYVETRLEGMVEYTLFSQVATHARSAMQAIEQRIDCTHQGGVLVVSSDWHEDEEVMSEVRECRKCKRRATFTGSLVYGQVARGEWS
jgi:hypothetical protein